MAKRRRRRYDLDLDDLGLDLDFDDFAGPKGKRLVRVTKGKLAGKSYWRTATPKKPKRRAAAAAAAAPRTGKTKGAYHCAGKFHYVVVGSGPQKGKRVRRCAKFTCT